MSDSFLPAQHRRKPNLERNKLTESPHALLLVSSQLPPAQLHKKPTASSGTRQDSPTEILHENLPAQPHRKPNPERDRITENPHALLSVPSHLRPAQPHRIPTASSGTRQDSLAESPHENLTAQPRRKPKPETDRLTESPHALLFVSSHLRPAQHRRKSHCFFPHPPGQPYRKSA